MMMLLQLGLFALLQSVFAADVPHGHGPSNHSHGLNHTHHPHAGNHSHHVINRELHIRIGTFITLSTPQFIIDGIRENFRRNSGPHYHKCIVRHTFFVGRGGNFSGQLEHSGSEAGAHPGLGDVVQGDFEENMNGGKTFEWFVTALKRYPRADMIFKSDTDTAINVESLCRALTSADLQEYAYVGTDNAPCTLSHH